MVRASKAPAPYALGAMHMETYAEGYTYCELRAGGTRYDFQSEREAFTANSEFNMQGAALYRISSEAAPGFIARLLAKADWKQDEVDLVELARKEALVVSHMLVDVARHADAAARAVASCAAMSSSTGCGKMLTQVASSLSSALCRPRPACQVDMKAWRGGGWAGCA